MFCQMNYNEQRNDIKLPLVYRWLKANGFKGFAPWYLIEESDREGLRKEYQKETGKDVLPIARRQDCDDIAGFEIMDGQITQRVVSVHLSWIGKREKKGFPSEIIYNDMFEWLTKEIIPDTSEWMSEEELADLE
ncbi:MAG: hypothetical protein GY757_42320 [bacterium]|nr:hypothetical protein [bacterium]